MLPETELGEEHGSFAFQKGLVDVQSKFSAKDRLSHSGRVHEVPDLSGSVVAPPGYADLDGSRDVFQRAIRNARTFQMPLARRHNGDACACSHKTYNRLLGGGELRNPRTKTAKTPIIGPVGM